MCTKGGTEVIVKRKFVTVAGNRNPIIQPVASYFTESAITVLW